MTVVADMLGGMPRFLLPVEGLRLGVPWTLGVVRLHDDVGGQSAVASYRAEDLTKSRLPLGQWHLDIFDQMAASTVAEVVAEDIVAAVDLVGDALDQMRVYLYWRAQMRTTTFGLPGDVRLANIRYLELGERTGAGWRNDGEVLGSTWPASEAESFASSIFARTANLVGATDLHPGPARARLALRLLSLAIREHRPDMKQLATVIAIETLLGGGGQRFRLAQRAVFFTCGLPYGDLCGRTRPVCEYLSFEMEQAAAQRKLKSLERTARTGHRLCSEWVNFLDRYDDRSGVAHGDPSQQVSAEDAGRDLWWAIKQLATPVISFLLDHPEDPLEDMSGAIKSLGKPPGDAAVPGA